MQHELLEAAASGDLRHLKSTRRSLSHSPPASAILGIWVALIFGIAFECAQGWCGRWIRSGAAPGGGEDGRRHLGAAARRGQRAAGGVPLPRRRAARGCERRR